MMLCNPLKKCEFDKCGLCNKPCKRPPCKPQCPCIKKIEDVKEDLNTLKGDVDRNKQKIENNYNLLNDAISDLAEKHAHDHNYVLNYIDEKDAENDYLLEQEIIRAKAAEQDIDDRLAKEIADRIEDVNNEENRATIAEQVLNSKIDQEIADRIADVDAEESRAKQAENDLSDRLDQEIQDRIADVDAEEDRAKAAELDLSDRLDQEIADRIADVDAEEDRAKTAEQNLDDKLDQEIVDRIADVDAEETRATAAETDIINNLNQEIQNRIDGDTLLQQNITNLEEKHNQDIQDMNDHLDDILGIDAQGVSEIKAILSDDDTTTGLITELAKKATIVDLQAEIDRSTDKDNSHDTSIQNLQDNKANKSNMSAGTYRSVTVNSEGIVTDGTNPTTLDGYGITDAKIENGTITLGSNSITPLTQHQDISSKADSADVYTKTEVDNIINVINQRLTVLEGYWTLNDTTNRLETSYIIEPEGYR